MIKVLKKKKYYYFLKDNKALDSTLHNKIQIHNEKVAFELCKYLSLIFKSKKKEKLFFLRVLFFSFDLNKNRRSDILDKMVSFLSTDLVC